MSAPRPPSRLRPPLTADQQALVLSVAKRITFLARRFARRWPALRLEDYEQIGHEAAAEAARTFSGAAGDFARFSYKRIRGEMQDQATRELRHRHPPLAAADAAEAAYLDTPVEFPSALEDTREAARDRAVDWSRGFISSMAVAFLASSEPSDTEQAVIAREEYARGHAALRSALAGLAEHESRLVDLRIVRGLPQHHVAGELGVTERTVQRHEAELLRRLRKQLLKLGITGAPPVEGRPDLSSAGQGIVRG